MLQVRVVSYFILLILFLSIFVPSLIRFMPVFLMLCLAGGLVALNSRFTVSYYLFPVRLGVLFVVFGGVYFISSLFVGGWFSGYRFEFGYIFRQSYFVFLFPVFVMVGFYLYGVFLEKKIVLYKVSPFVFVLILFLDVLSSYAWGDVGFREYNGYAYFFEKGIIWLFVCFFYYFSVVYKSRSFFCFVFLNVFFLIQVGLGYGVMFNAMTGVVLYLIMFSFYLCKAFFVKRSFLFFGYFLSISSLFLFVLIAPFYSDLFYSDLNTYWRLVSWGDNLESVLNNYGLGAGFGVAYFPNTQEALDAAYRSYLKEGSGYSMYDSLFIRGQHSSIVNVFFRLGLLGGVVFLGLILSFIFFSNKFSNDPDVYFLMPIFVSGVLNVSVHVGFESPPFLISISLVFGFLIGAFYSCDKQRDGECSDC